MTCGDVTGNRAAPKNNLSEIEVERNYTAVIFQGPDINLLAIESYNGKKAKKRVSF